MSDFFVSANIKKISVDVQVDNIRPCHRLYNSKKTIVECFKQTVCPQVKRVNRELKNIAQLIL